MLDRRVVGTRRWWLALCALSMALFIPAEATARPGGGRSYSRPGSSSGSSGYSSPRKRHYDYEDEADTPTEQDLENQKEAQEIADGSQAGRQAARDAIASGTGFDPMVSPGFGSDEYAYGFFKAYRREFQPRKQEGDCLEIYYVFSSRTSTAYAEGQIAATGLSKKARERLARMPLCASSVANREQAAAYRRGLREGPKRHHRTFWDRHGENLLLVLMVGGLIGITGFAIYRRNRKTRVAPMPVAATGAVAVAKPPAAKKERDVDFDEIRRYDPNFSLILFEDYVFRLYAQLHREAAPGGDLDGMSLYATRSQRDKLRAFHKDDSTPPTVVVGSLKPLYVKRVDAGKIRMFRITCRVEANITAGQPGKERTLYLQQELDLARRIDAQTRPPDGVKTFGCPICHAPFSTNDTIRCAHCGSEVADGRVAWLVNYIGTNDQRELPPALTTTHPERGHELPTVVDPGMAATWQALCADDPAVTHEAIAARLNFIYHGLNAGWTAIDERQLRPHVSDGLFDYFRYWLAAYRRQGLKNKLESMRLTGWELAKVARDAFYDAITVRIYGTGLDYTINAQTGAIVSGSNTVPRAYTEYWTLIRGRGVRGAPRTDPQCPNCGAPLAINMGGNCEHCQVHVTSGEFDWVLSKIEQDEAYRR